MQGFKKVANYVQDCKIPLSLSSLSFPCSKILQLLTRTFFMGNFLNNVRVQLHWLCLIFKAILLVIWEELLHSTEKKTPCIYYHQNQTDRFVNRLSVHYGDKWLCTILIYSYKFKSIPVRERVSSTLIILIWRVAQTAREVHYLNTKWWKAFRSNIAPCRSHHVTKVQYLTSLIFHLCRCLVVSFPGIDFATVCPKNALQWI